MFHLVVLETWPGTRAGMWLEISSQHMELHRCICHPRQHRRLHPCIHEGSPRLVLHWASPAQGVNPGIPEIIKKMQNRRFGGPRPDTPKLVKKYKIEDPGGPREIIEKLYPKRRCYRGLPGHTGEYVCEELQRPRKPGPSGRTEEGTLEHTMGHCTCKRDLAH